MKRLSITRDRVVTAAVGLRPTLEARDDVRRTVADIIDMIRRGGDDALRRLTSRLDGADLAQSRVKAGELARALDEIDPAVREAIELLASNLRTVATELLPPPTRVELPQGQIVSTRHVPVQRAGLYVPGGGAAYPSSAVMAIVPAQVAGVPQICVCSPPAADGRVHSAILAVCALLGVTEVYAAGGAQAVAAMALGTEAIPAVDVVVGPGNAYVEEAKRRLFGEVGIESLAGPSELIILADTTAPAEHLAWDLMAQAEHGSGAQSVLVSPDPDVIAAVAEHLAEGDVTLIETDSWETAIEFVNEYAPEHLQLAVADPAAVLEQIVHAGAIFLDLTRELPSATTWPVPTTSCRRPATHASRPGWGPWCTCAPRRSSRFPSPPWRHWSRRWLHWPSRKDFPITPARRPSEPNGSPNPRKDVPADAAQS